MSVAYDGAGSAANDVAAWLAPYETPFDYTAPSVSGDPVVGSPLTCEPGTWAEPTASFGYTWETVGAGGANPINGADQQTYTPAATDLGSRLECEVTATVSGFGSTNSVASAPVSVAPASLSLMPAAQRVVPGDTVDYSAEGLDVNGNSVGDVTAATTFSIAPDSSGSATGASCSANGCQATVAGTYTVTGTDGAATGSTTMIVVAGMPTSLSLSPSVASAATRVSQVYQAEAFDFYGNDAGDVTASTSFAIAPSGGTGSQTGASCSGDACSATVPGTYIVTGTDTQARLATGTATLTVTAATSVSTSLSGGGHSGADLSVPPGTAVTDQASLSGADAASATGTVTYDVYSDSACSTLAGAGSPESITTPGVLPASAAQTLSTPGTYYWQATYSGDSANALSTSPCGSEVETVTPPAQSTSLFNSLIGGGDVGAAVSVPSGTAVSDQAILSGTNAASATGTVVYDVYSDSDCSALVSAGSPQTITSPGTLPLSLPQTFTTLGTYYWQATYGGDSMNQPSTSPCGSAVETVVAPPTPTNVSTSLSGGGQSGGVISVPAGTAVGDQASLSGVNAATASGTVTYAVYADSACTMLAFADAPQPITTPGVLPASPPSTATATGTFYWQATYSGDSANAGSKSSCGSEVQIVRPAYKYGADVAVILQIAPVATVTAGGAFSISVTVTNGGPKPATSVIADLSVPSGLTVTNADGGTKLGRRLLWKAGTLLPGQATTYTVTVTVAANATGTATVSAGALSLGTVDPGYQDNFATDQLTFTAGDGVRRLTVGRAHANDALLRARLRAAGRALRLRAGG
jgi:hypothetical protein